MSTAKKDLVRQLRGRLGEMLANSVIVGLALFAFAAAILSVVNRGGRRSASTALFAGELAAIATLLLLVSLRFAAVWRMRIAMVLLPAFLAAIAADFFFVMKERRLFHVIDGHQVPRLASEEPVVVLREKGILANSFIGPVELSLWQQSLRDDTTRLLPLAGRSRTLTYLCREADKDVIYDSDEYGFNNPPGSWKDRIDVALVGDSFLHGVCVPTEDQIGTIIRQAIPATVNVGIGGAGPLAELGVVREYLAAVNPRLLVWFFYEGNDTLRGWPDSLRDYLDSTYSQHLSSRQQEIDSLLRHYANTVSSAPLERSPIDAGITSTLLLRHLRTALGVGLPSPPPPHSKDDYVAVERSLSMARNIATKGGGEMYLVYLPDSHRFQPRSDTDRAHHDDTVIHSVTLAAARQLGIPVIDISPVFAADANPARFWYRPMSHYTPAGTRLVARTVLARLAANGKMAVQ